MSISDKSRETLFRTVPARFMLESMIDPDMAIVNQTLEGQQEIAEQDVRDVIQLPRQGSELVDYKGERASGQTFVDWGVKFFGDDPQDKLFCRARLPAGWSIKPTDHHMYSSICDARGNVRGSFGYKGAFYDRWASMYAVRRIQTSRRHEHPQWSETLQEALGQRWIQGTVQDSNGRLLYCSEWFEDDRASVCEATEFRTMGDVLAEKASSAWIAEHFPRADDVMAYWDDELTYVEPTPAPQIPAEELAAFRAREQAAIQAAEMRRRREENDRRFNEAGRYGIVGMDGRLFPGEFLRDGFDMPTRRGRGRK